MIDPQVFSSERPAAERLLLKALRMVSPRWRAHIELFVDPYRRWVEWESGLGEAGRVLYSLARMTRPSVIVEIGSSRGNSTCCFALACDENQHGHVFAIDPHTGNDWSDVGTGGGTLAFLQNRLQTYQLADRCTVVRKTSQEAAVGWQQPIDLLFIDGDHSLDGVKTDFELFGRWLSADGLVVFHDSSWEHFKPWAEYKMESMYPTEMGVPKYLDALQREGYASVTLSPIPGLTIMHAHRGGFEFLKSLQRQRDSVTSSL